MVNFMCWPGHRLLRYLVKRHSGAFVTAFLDELELADRVKTVLPNTEVLIQAVSWSLNRTHRVNTGIPSACLPFNWNIIFFPYLSSWTQTLVSNLPSDRDYATSIPVSGLPGQDPGTCPLSEPVTTGANSPILYNLSISLIYMHVVIFSLETPTNADFCTVKWGTAVTST